MGRRLNCNVSVIDDNNQVHWFGPKSEIPPWAEERITNPDVWQDEGEASDDVPSEVPEATGPGAVEVQQTGRILTTQQGVYTEEQLLQFDADQLQSLAYQVGIELRGDEPPGEIVQQLLARG